MRYTGDAISRLVRRDASTGDSTATVIYGYTGSGDTADIALIGDLRLATRSPADVSLRQGFVSAGKPVTA